jgi:aspartate aminotransferase
LQPRYLAVLEVGDEVLDPRPGWINYAALIRGAAGTPVPVDLTPESFDLDPGAICCDWPAHAGNHREHAPQSDRSDLSPRATRCSR